MANRRAQVLLVVFAFSALVGAYSIISSFMGLRAAEQEVQDAQKDLNIATQEVAVAQDHYDNVIRYGCASPMVGQGFVSCPN